MSIKTKYQTMGVSEYTDSEGNNYPDIATFPIDNFTMTTKPSLYKLTYNDTMRFFDLIYKFYGDFPLYDDITLWLNDIAYISDSDTNFEKEIKFYSKEDIDNWYIASVKGEIVDDTKKVIV